MTARQRLWFGCIALAAAIGAFVGGFAVEEMGFPSGLVFYIPVDLATTAAILTPCYFVIRPRSRQQAPSIAVRERWLAP